MKKILHIGMSSSLGGIEVFVKNLFDNINHEEFQFDFVDTTVKGICYKEYFEKNNCKVFKVTPRRKNTFKNRKELEQIIKNNRYDIIHYHLNTLSYITPIILANKCKVRIIIHSHNEWKGNNLKTRILDKINRKRISTIPITRLACSEVAGRWIFNEKKFEIIDNGINIKEFLYNEQNRKDIREELNISDSCTVVGHVGAFREQKNHNFLIDIYNEYLKNNSNSILLLVGDGKLKQEIKEKVKILHIEQNVKFLGVRNDISNLLSVMDLFIFPSKFEGLPISLVEAQIAGLPCLASNTITKEIDITGNVDFLSIDETKLYAWVDKMLNINYHNRIMNLDNEKIKKFDIKNTAHVIERVYNKL